MAWRRSEGVEYMRRPFASPLMTLGKAAGRPLGGGECLNRRIILIIDDYYHLIFISIVGKGRWLICAPDRFVARGKRLGCSYWWWWTPWALCLRQRTRCRRSINRPNRAMVMVFLMIFWKWVEEKKSLDATASACLLLGYRTFGPIGPYFWAVLKRYSDSRITYVNLQ